jgi:putative nucleotidyltransferase with HDIG domain
MPDFSPTPGFALVFDWGNTLMRVFPEYNGPMADWPEVAEVAGVVETLEALLGNYPMVVATNAGDSKTEQVWKALRRVGLGEYFKAVFTSGELGAKKPELRFFRGLESVLARAPYNLVMIGDDFHADVLGAKNAGWKTIWYNPGWQAAPGLLPLHDAEIHDLRELPGALGSLSLPDQATCLAWLIDRGTPHNILAHIQLVAAIAYQLAAWLGQAGEAVDPVLTHRGAMLHDLAKFESVQKKDFQRSVDSTEYIDHAELASKLLMERGQPELAEIAARHMLYSDPADPRRPRTWEQKLVHFADKLAEGTSLVAVDDRLRALQERYPQAAQEMTGSKPILTALQQEICGRLHLPVDDLIARLRQATGLK